MADQATAATVETPVLAPVEPGEVDTVDSRADELIKTLRAEKNAPKPSKDGPDDDEGEPVEAPDAGEDADEGDVEEVEPLAAAPVVDPAAEQRKAALKRAAELEKKAHSANERVLAREARATERERVAVEREKAADARATEAERILSALKDPSTALELIGKHVDADKLGGWMLESQDPVKRAEWAAVKAAKEASAPSPEMVAAIEEMRAMKQELAQTRHDNTRRSEEQAVVNLATSNAEHVPYASALATHKPQKFLALVHATAQALRARGEQLSYERIVEQVEEDLSDLSPVYAPKHAAAEAAPSAAPAPAPASKARSLSSRTTAGRSTLASQDDKPAPLDDRVAELKRRIAQGDSF